MNDIKDCIVWVSGHEQIGTGYVVSKTQVITCAHVISKSDQPPEEKVEIEFLISGDRVEATVDPNAWSPQSQDDIAVLIFSGDLPTGVVPAILATSAERKGNPCEVFGFADVGEVDGVGGTAKIVEYTKTYDGKELLQLESNHIEPGFSGSPLLDKTTDEVIGTVVEMVEERKFATPMEAIAKYLPDVWEFNQNEQERQQLIRSALVDAICRILKPKDALEYLLSVCEPEGCGRDQDKNRKILACYLLQSPLSDFLPIVLQGFRKYRRSDPSLATAIRDLAMYILPQIYKTSFLRALSVRLSSDENLLQIPASSKSVIELYLAGCNGAKLEFDGDWKFDGDIPAGKFEIPAYAELGPPSETEYLSYVAEVTAKFEEAIMMRIGGLPRKWKGTARTKAINRALHNKRNQVPPIRYYFVFETENEEVEELASVFPDIVFVRRLESESDFDEEEFDIFDAIKEMHDPEDDQ